MGEARGNGRENNPCLLSSCPSTIVLSFDLVIYETQPKIIPKNRRLRRQKAHHAARSNYLKRTTESRLVWSSGKAPASGLHLIPSVTQVTKASYDGDSKEKVKMNIFNKQNNRETLNRVCGERRFEPCDLTRDQVFLVIRHFHISHNTP